MLPQHGAIANTYAVRMFCGYDHAESFSAFSVFRRGSKWSVFLSR